MAKHYQELVWARGWESVDGYICSSCVTEPYLASMIADQGELVSCDYCDNASGPAVEADTLLEQLVEGFRFEYGNPDDEGVAYDGREGGYQMPTYTTWDLLDEFEVTENVKVQEAIAYAVENLWCERNPYEPTPHQALTWGWAGFREHVKHRTRFLFLLPSRDDGRGWGDIPPENMPDAIVAAVVDSGLARRLPVGTRFYRARVHDATERPMTAKDLGSPPPERAKTNRMTAAGIAGFYGASTPEGALAEVRGYMGPDDYATLGAFVTGRDMIVIDLVDLPYVPSLFDPARRHLRAAISFLRGFAKDVAEVAHPDDKEHLEYVPTQVVAEYLKHVYEDPRGPVMGVLWRSSKDPKVTDCVLFVDNKGCVEHGPDWSNDESAFLALEPGSQVRVPPA